MQQRIGPYQVLEEIASGAQGAVYRTFDPQTSQIVALKVLHASLTSDPAYIERFRREASLAASIDHPNVVKIIEVGRDGDSYFIAMEFLPESLARVVQAGGPMDVGGAVEFAVQIAQGLAAAHALGIVHRDIKPQNILIGPDGRVKVTDFGIARAQALNTMTATGAIMGTPHYMSPEQARGRRADIRSDLYSLGCVLYQMLSGKVPFDADTPLGVLDMHRETPPPRIRQVRRDVPRAVEAVVDRCLEKDPARRYQTPQELVAALSVAMPQARPVRPSSEAPVLERTPGEEPGHAPRHSAPPPPPGGPPERPVVAESGKPSGPMRLISKGGGVILALWGTLLVLGSGQTLSQGETASGIVTLVAGATTLIAATLMLRRSRLRLRYLQKVCKQSGGVPSL